MTAPLALAVSPHLDDAVFSCGGTLARLAAGGWRTVLYTAFTASIPDPTGFALACQTDKGIPPEIDYMALRRTEDAAAAADLDLDAPAWGDLAEAPHRGYGDPQALFRPPRHADRAADDLADRLGIDRSRPVVVAGSTAPRLG